MDDLEQIRARKMRELRERQAAQAQDPQAARQAEEARRAEEEEAIESFLQQILDEDARARLTRIRMSRPALADSVARHLVSLAQSGKLHNRITDDELRALLLRLQPDDRDIKITRK